MKFIKLVTVALTLSPQVLAAPKPVPEPEPAIEARANAAISTIVSAIGTLTGTITTELADIATVIQSGVADQQIISVVEESLTTITNALQTALSTVRPVLTGPIPAFTTAELTALIAAIGSLRTTITQLVNTLLMTASLSDVVTVAIAPELQALVALLSPLVNPLITFVLRLLTRVTSLSLVGQLLSAVLSLGGILTSLLSPVTGLLQAILG